MKKLLLLTLLLLVCPAWADERVKTLHSICAQDPANPVSPHGCSYLLAIQGRWSQWPYQPGSSIFTAETAFSGMAPGVTFDNLFGTIQYQYTTSWGSHMQSWSVQSLHRARITRSMTYLIYGGVAVGTQILYSMDYAGTFACNWF
jgi:hypothetical protein